MGLNTDFGFDFSQPLPKSSDPRNVVDEVKKDLLSPGGEYYSVADDFERRRQGGIKKYGIDLKPFNGRNALIDAYAEAIDLVNYLKQAVIERGEKSYFISQSLKYEYKKALSLCCSLRDLIEIHIATKEKDEPRIDN